jgi:hypothetical protein
VSNATGSDQRGVAGVVAKASRAAGGLSIPLTAPADRLAAEGVGGRHDLTWKG